MATSTNTAEIYVGANEVAGVVAIALIPPGKKSIVSMPLGSDAVAIGVGNADDLWRIEIDVETDKTDTNGQVALNTAYAGGSSVSVVYYPEGNTTGNESQSATAYVTQIPTSGGNGRNDVKSGKYILDLASEPTEGTVS